MNCVYRVKLNTWLTRQTVNYSFSKEMRCLFALISLVANPLATIFFCFHHSWCVRSLICHYALPSLHLLFSLHKPKNMDIISKWRVIYMLHDAEISVHKMEVFVFSRQKRECRIYFCTHTSPMWGVFPLCCAIWTHFFGLI